MFLLIYLCGILSAIGRRWHGGLFKTWFNFDPGLQPLRLLWGIMATAPLFLLLPWWHVLGFAVSIFVGSTMGFPKNAMIPTTFNECLGTAQHAALGVALSTTWAWYLGYMWIFPLTGIILCPFAYWIAHRFPVNLPIVSAYTNDTPPMAELYWGFARGLTIAAIILFL